MRRLVALAAIYDGASRAEAKVLIEQWRKHYNTVRPHSALGYRPPAPEVMLTALRCASSAMARAGATSHLAM